MTKVTSKKGAYQVKSKLLVKVVTNVVLQIKEEEEERSLTKPVFGVTTVINMVIMVKSIVQT